VAPSNIANAISGIRIRILLLPNAFAEWYHGRIDGDLFEIRHGPAIVIGHLVA
jgi:hypothetical protein